MDAAAGPPVGVAVAQGAIPQDVKRVAENLESTQELYRQLTRKARGAPLIVWPESAAPDLANNNSAFYRDIYFREASAQRLGARPGGPARGR